MMVTHRERVEAALSGEVIDRPPVSAWGHIFDDEWFPNRLAHVTARNSQTYDWDWVKLQNRDTVFAEALGVPYRPSPDGASFPIRNPDYITAKRDWEEVIERAKSQELALPLKEQVESIKTLRSLVAPDTPIMQTVFSPLSVVGYLVEERFDGTKRWIYEEPELMSRVLEAVGQMQAKFAEESINAGADGVYFAIMRFASRDHLNEADYRDHVLRSDRVALEGSSSGWFNMLHMCGSSIHLHMAKEWGCHAVSWSPSDEGNPSLEEARALTDIARVGGLHRRTPIGTGAPWQVYRAVQDVLAATTPRGLMIGPNCSVTPWPVGREHNFQAMRAALHP